MAVHSLHTIAATVGANTLDVKSSSLTMDDSWAPYVQGTLVCFAPTPTVIETINPLAPGGLRVSITVTADYGDDLEWNAIARDPVTRTFDLALRSNVIDHNTGEMTITVESDEALLRDYSLLAITPDVSQFANKASLRTIVNYALGKVGAVLQSGAADEAYFVSSENVIDNPRAAVNVTNYSGASNLGALTPSRLTGTVPGGTFSARVTATASSTSLTVTNGSAPTMNNVTGGLRYSVSTNARTNIGSSAVLIVQWKNAAGTLISDNRTSAISLAAGNFSRLGMNNMLAPLTATSASVIVTASASFAATTGTLDVTATRLSAVPSLMNTINDYFDGDSIADANYTYSWAGTAHLSHSTRTAIVPTDQGAFTWLPGVAAWDYLSPLIAASGLRLFCDEMRHWYLVASVQLDGLISLSPETGIERAADSRSLDDDSLYYTGVVITYQAPSDPGTGLTPAPVYEMAGTQGRVLAISRDTAFPGAGAAVAILNRAGGKGRTLEVTAESNYLTTPGKALTITLPDTPVQSGLVSSVSWSFPDARMTVGSKGLTDTPANAWLLAVGSWSAATGSWAGATGTN